AFRKVSDERQYKVELADRIKIVRRMYHIASRATRQRRRRNDRNLTMTESRAGELTVISRGIGCGSLILRAQFVRLVGSLCRSASPIGGARQHNRIARTVVNVGEVRERCGSVVQKSQGN